MPLLRENAANSNRTLQLSFSVQSLVAQKRIQMMDHGDLGFYFQMANQCLSWKKNNNHSVGELFISCAAYLGQYHLLQMSSYIIFFYDITKKYKSKTFICALVFSISHYIQ